MKYIRILYFITMIQKALSKKGSKGKLYLKLGIPEGEKIPLVKLNKAKKSKGALGKESRLSETLKSFRKK